MNPVAVGEGAYAFFKKHPMFVKEADKRGRQRMSDNAVDYIVVGAGTAGCIVASRLSIDPHKEWHYLRWVAWTPIPLSTTGA